MPSEELRGLVVGGVGMVIITEIVTVGLRGGWRVSSG